MTFRPIIAILSALLLSSVAIAAAQERPATASEPAADGGPVPVNAAAPLPAPDLSESAINGADLKGYAMRLQAREQAAKAASEKPAGDPVAETINKQVAKGDPDPFLIRMQVLLDRAHASPGVIDGLDGGNTAKAIRSFTDLSDMKAADKPDQAIWDALRRDGAPAVKSYTITEEDVNQPYIPNLPTDYAKLAELDSIAYRDPAEMLAERFHMDENLLKRLNPDADLAKAGTRIVVADPGADPDPDVKVERIVIDKSRGELFAYAKDGKLILAYPATIGSSDTPSPSGTMKVNGSKANPDYAYDPKNFVQGENRKKLTLPPGPNGPVGNMWIDLSKPTYGIHGTPEPSEIDKTASHGCVRLTNWDAQALAKLVQPAKTIVEFEQ